MDQATFGNSAQERWARHEMERIISEVTAPIVASAKTFRKRADMEAKDYAETLAEHEATVRKLRRKMQRRQIIAKEARAEIGKLRREEENLTLLYDDLTHAYEKGLHDEGHPEEVADFLYKTYPVAPPYFPI